MSQAGEKQRKREPEEQEHPPASALGILREWADALVIAFLLAMFIRTFVVELFKIPSGSMTPTLIGTSSEKVIEWDVDQNGEKDLILDRGPRVGFRRYHVFYRENGKFIRPNEFHSNLRLPLEAQMKGRMRNDRIIVNKFIYWFRKPRRGEIVVFRVPAHSAYTGEPIFERDKPIYIKRVVGLPNEEIEIRPPDLYANGKKVDSPDVFQHIEYTRENFPFCDLPARERTMPAHSYLLMGDNSKNSKDGRAFGPVEERSIKGMALLRYWPIDTIGFLE